MAVQLIDRRGRSVKLTSELLLQLLEDGNNSEIEGFPDEDNINDQSDAVQVRSVTPVVAITNQLVPTPEQASIESPRASKPSGCKRKRQPKPSCSFPPASSSAQPSSDAADDQSPAISVHCVTPNAVIDQIIPTRAEETTDSPAESTVSQSKRKRKLKAQPASRRAQVTSRRAQSASIGRQTVNRRQPVHDQAGPSKSSTNNSHQEQEPPPGRREIWRNVPFNQKAHNYPLRDPVSNFRTALQYFQDYFSDEFYEQTAACTNLYHMRKTGRVLNTNAAEIKTLIGLHFIMGCIPYPRLHMYWRNEMSLKLISDNMTRDRFKTLRTSLHVVPYDTAPEGNSDVLWKVQPVLDCVKNACQLLERVPGYYSIDEQMIPFCGVCPRGLRQVIKSKPRPQGLKAFVVATHDGLMLDFEIYKGARTAFADRSLGIGASVILHLSQSIPPGSCVFFDRYFTSVPLLERMSENGLHGTGTVMANRIPDKGSKKFKEDRHMTRGESQQLVRNGIVVVKWMDNKAIMVASNCTSADNEVYVHRWDKKQNAFIEVKQPAVIAKYNQNMGGVDVLDQSIEYYRTFMKTKKWTLKVMLHFFDLAVANAWRLYKIHCETARIHSSQVMDLLKFKLDVADGLINAPNRARIDDDEPRKDSEDDEELCNNPQKKKYRPANPPSESKRYDGFEHFPQFDEIDNPRSCRMEGCKSRSKIRCKKCNVYLCLTRKSNCYTDYHLL